MRENTYERMTRTEWVEIAAAAAIDMLAAVFLVTAERFRDSPLFREEFAEPAVYRLLRYCAPMVRRQIETFPCSLRELSELAAAMKRHDHQFLTTSALGRRWMKHRASLSGEMPMGTQWVSDRLAAELFRTNPVSV